MNVPNIEKKAFRDMTAEERSAVVEAKISGIGVEFFCTGTKAWVESVGDAIAVSTAYRTKQRKLEIPWEHIKPEFKWAAMDEDGAVYIYNNKPIMGRDGWDWDEGALAGINNVLNIDTSGIDWRESLTQRHEN